MNRLTAHLITLTALLTIVLTIALPLAELLTTPTTPASTHTTTPASEETPSTSKADKAAAHVDGCRQQPPTPDTLLARPSCRSGMPVTRDHSTLQAPDNAHPDAHPIAPNEVPPAWSDHWGAAAHSPHHHSQA